MSDIQCPRYTTGDWLEWRQIYDAFAELKGWDEHKKLVALPLYLEGTARQAFQSLSADQRATWARASAALLQVFAPEEDGAEDKFFARRQRTGETMASFAAGLRALGNAAFGEHNDATKEKLLLKQFLKGINKTVAEETIRQNPRSLNAAVVAAQEGLQIQKVLKEIVHDSEVPTTAKEQVGLIQNKTQTDELREIRESLVELSNTVEKLSLRHPEEYSRRTAIERARDRTPDRLLNAARERVRFRSPSPGTSRKNDRRDNYNRRNYNRERLRGGTEEIRCYECGGIGHFQKECANKNRKKAGN